MLVGGNTSKICRTASSMARTSGGGTPKSRESQREDKDALVILVRSFMRLNLRVKQTCEHAGGTVATLDKYSCECFRRGRKVRSRDSIHSGEKGEKKVKQVRVITIPRNPHEPRVPPKKEVGGSL